MSFVSDFNCHGDAHNCLPDLLQHGYGNLTSWRCRSFSNCIAIITLYKSAWTQSSVISRGLQGWWNDSQLKPTECLFAGAWLVSVSQQAVHRGGLDVRPRERLHGLEWWGLLPLQGLHVSHLVTQRRGARITTEWLFHPDQFLNEPCSVRSNTLCWERVPLCEGRQVS